MRLTLPLIFSTCALALSGCMTQTAQHSTSADDSSAHHASAHTSDHYQFKASSDALAQVMKKQALAKQQDKLLMVILGATWCHDSRGLAARFSDDTFNQKLNEQYEIQFVDVGYLNTGFDVLEHFGLSVFYGTPTVLIVDPNTGEQLNKQSYMTWFNADSQQDSTYENYFQNQSFRDDMLTVEQQQQMDNYLTQIQAFEKRQALILKQAYGVIGPMLHDYKEKDGKTSPHFDAYWDEVRDFRFAVPKSINRLIDQAKANSRQGNNQPLTFPELPAISFL